MNPLLLIRAALMARRIPQNEGNAMEQIPQMDEGEMITRMQLANTGGGPRIVSGGTIGANLKAGDYAYQDGQLQQMGDQGLQAAPFDLRELLKRSLSERR